MDELDTGRRPSNDAWHPDDQHFDLFVIDALDGPELERFRQHLRHCARCALRLKQEARMETAIRETVRDMPLTRRLSRVWHDLWSRLRGPSMLLVPVAAGGLMALRASYIPLLPSYTFEAHGATATLRSSPAPASRTTDEPLRYYLSGRLTIDAVPATDTDSPVEIELALRGPEGRVWRRSERAEEGAGRIALTFSELDPRPEPGAYTVDVTVCPRDLLFLVLRQRARCQLEALTFTLLASP